MGAGFNTPAALAPGDQYRPARPRDRVCTGQVQDQLRAGPRRANLCRRPQSRHGRSRGRASVRMDRATANGRAARVQPGTVPVDGQRRRVDAATARRYDLDPPPSARAELMESPPRVALGGGRQLAQEPGASVSTDRRDRQKPKPARVFRRYRSFRAAGADAAAAAAAAGTPPRPIDRTGRRRGGRRPAWRAPGLRGGPGGGQNPPTGPRRAVGDSIPTRSYAPACTALGRDCSSCTGTCFARSAASRAR